MSVAGAVRWYAWGTLLTGWARMGVVDWAEQKIRHRFLVIWAAMTAAGYGVLALHTIWGLWRGGDGWLLPAWWGAAAVHLVVSVAAAMTLWLVRVWPAGDAKLFVLLAALIGLARLPLGFHGGTLFLEALINIFLPAAAYLFVVATLYLWKTRFAHQAAFLRELGPKRAAPWFRDKMAEAWLGLVAERDSWIESFKDPKKLAIDALLFFLSMLAMSLLSYYVGERLGSPLTKTLVTFAFFFLWSRVSQAMGKGLAVALVGGVSLILIMRTGRPDFEALGVAFGHISVFTLCIFFGIQLAFKLALGQAGYAFMPFVFMIPMLVPPLWRELREHGLPNLPALPALPAVAGDAGLLTWACMGIFFGLSIVFVRIWDEESYMSVNPDQIRSRMNLGPKLAAQIEEDEDFSEEFGPLYADGITEEQVGLLRQWCHDNEVATVPLAPTISFANWVYLGYVLTALLDGHVLRRLY